MTVPIHEPGQRERRIAGGLVRRLLYPRRPSSDHIPPADRLLPRVTFEAVDGALLSGIHHPAADPHGIVVLVHPDKRTAKHWWTRSGVPAWLNAHGLDAFAFDLGVYGESRGGNVYLHEHVIAAVAEAARLRPGSPIHLWGVSLGGYAAANAAVALPGLSSLVLESVYPTFRAWYAANGRPIEARVVQLLERLFPATYARIDAAANVAHLETPRILHAATTADRVTPVRLSRAVADTAPAHAQYVEYASVAHLRLFCDAPEYRADLLDTFGRPHHTPPHRVAAPLVAP